MKALATNVGFGVCVNNNNVTIEPDTVISADKWVRFMFAYIANR